MKSGTILESAFERYEIENQIGEGGCGTVYKVKNAKGQIFAAKTISKAKNEEKIKRFKNEMSFCFKTENENIVRVVDFGIHKSDGLEFLFYIMPFYASNLRKLMGKEMGAEQIVSIFMGISNGLKYAHSKECIHRDIKPENILISDEGNAVIGDFGIAHFLEMDKVTTVETTFSNRLANFSYHAPEQIEGKSTFATDIFALGLVLNEMFTHKIPVGENYLKIGDCNIDYSFLDKIVQKMIFQDCEKRYQSIDSLLIDFEAHKEVASKQRNIAALTQPVTDGEIDDPVYNNPITPIDIKTDKGTLFVELSYGVNDAWVSLYQDSLSSFTSSPYCYKNFRFYANKASYSLSSLGGTVDTYMISQLFSEFKNACVIANQRYRTFVKRKYDQRKADEIERRKQEIQRLQREIDLNQKLKSLL